MSSINDFIDDSADQNMFQKKEEDDYDFEQYGEKDDYETVTEEAE